MEVIENLANDDFDVVNAVASSVRAKRLRSHREKVIDNWRTKEIHQMKKKIASLTARREELKNKRKKLSQYNKSCTKCFDNLLGLDVPLNYCTMAMKFQLMTEKDELAKFKKDLADKLKKHSDCWNKTKLEWEALPRVKEFNKPFKQLEELREVRKKMSNDRSSKKEKRLLLKTRFQEAVVKFAQARAIYNKAHAESRSLPTIIKEVEDEVVRLRELKERQLAVAAEKEIQTKEKMKAYLMMDFDDFDLNLTSAENNTVHDVSMAECDFDPDCTNLSLEMCMEPLLSLSEHQMGTPLAMSTPLPPEPPTNQTTEAHATADRPIPQAEQIMTNTIMKNLANSQNPNKSQEISQISQQSSTPVQMVIEKSYPQHHHEVIQNEENAKRNSMANGNNEENYGADKNDEGNSSGHADERDDDHYKEMYAKSPEDHTLMSGDLNSPPPRMAMPSFNYEPPKTTSTLMSFFDFGADKQTKPDTASILDMF